MKLEDISVLGKITVPSLDEEVNELESNCGTQFPLGYREYVTKFGAGVLGGDYIRISTPERILTGINNVDTWRERVDEYWFWDDGCDVLTKDQALECFIIGDTVNGDELIFHPSQPNCIYILPRHSEKIYGIEHGLFSTLEWLCSSGILSESFEERNFEPFSV